MQVASLPWSSMQLFKEAYQDRDDQLIKYLVFHRHSLIYLTEYNHCTVDGSKMQIQHNSLINSLQIICDPGENIDTETFHCVFVLPQKHFAIWAGDFWFCFLVFRSFWLFFAFLIHI